MLSVEYCKLFRIFRHKDANVYGSILFFNTPSHCFTPLRFALFFFNASCWFTQLLNFQSRIFCLTPFSWLPSITLTPYLLWYYHCLFTPIFFLKRNYGVKQELVVTGNDCVLLINIQSIRPNLPQEEILVPFYLRCYTLNDISHSVQ